MEREDENFFYEYSMEKHIWTRKQRIILTNREKEIICLSARGFTVQEIADKLFLSELTIKSYKRDLFKKLNVKNISEAIKFSENNGLI